MKFSNFFAKMTTNINEHQIRELLRVNNYSQIEPCLRQIMQAIQKHSNLRPVMDTFQDSSTNFQPTNLLKLTGTLSIFYKNSTYHIPIDCFIPKTAPSWPPVTYVRPTSTMKLVHENNRNLGPDGKIYDQYITSWANSKGANRSNLRDCLDKFVKIFSARPPVCSTGNSQARPSPAAQPAGGQYQPYSAYPGMTSTQSTNYPPTSNYQPPTTGATAGSVPYPTNTPYPAMPYPTNNLPNYQGFNHGGSVYGQGHTPANQPPGYMNVVGEAGPPSQTQSNQRTQPPNRPPPPGQNLNRTSSISDNVVKDSLLIEANNLLIENASSKKDNDKKEISNMTNVLNQLNDNASNIESNGFGVPHFLFKSRNSKTYQLNEF